MKLLWDTQIFLGSSRAALENVLSDFSQPHTGQLLISEKDRLLQSGATTVAVARVAFADNRGNGNRLPIIAGVC